MKRTNFKLWSFLLVLNLSIVLSGISQVISPEHKEKAIKEGKSESEKLQKKGWINNLSGTDFESSMIRAFEAKYTKDSIGINFYVPAFGNAFGTTKEEAQNLALEKCKKGVFDIMMLYFSMWNSSNKNLNDNEIKQVENAIIEASPNVAEAFNNLKYETVASIYRQQEDKVEVQIRTIYNQSECKKVARQEIKKVLAAKFSISDEKGEQMLTYPK